MAANEDKCVFASQDECLIVAAIDFGTTFSGYAYSVKTKCGEVIMNKNWGKETGMTSFKAPTCVLTKLAENGRDHIFQDFGFQAENDYTNRLTGPEKDKLCLFNKFKMKLHREEYGGHMAPEPLQTIKDKRGKRETDAMSIFIMALRYIKDHLLKALSDLGDSSISQMDARYIRWVLTVPAIWTDQAKSFMHTAAFKAGLVDNGNSNRLQIALEPEAASIYCKSLRLNHFLGETEKTDVKMGTGTVYMVVDAGGGTVDITVHEVMESGEVMELCIARGGAWGGTSIDKEFWNLLIKIWGEEFIQKIQNEHPMVAWDIEKQFERIKRTASPVRPGNLEQCYYIFTLHVRMMQCYSKITNGGDITAITEPGVSINSDYQFVLSHQKMGEMFVNTITNIVSCIRGTIDEISKNHGGKNIDLLFMVGGLSGSPYLTEVVKSRFSATTKILIPENPELAILSGAVLFGENPSHITSRISRRTYGIATQADFDHEKHDLRKKRMVEGKEKCVDLFLTFIRKGEAVDISREVIRGFFPETSTSTSVGFKLLAANKEEVKYSDDPDACIEHIGTLAINMPDTTKGKQRYVEFTMKFGGTEIEAMAHDRSVMNGRKQTKFLQFITDHRQIPNPESDA